MINTLFNIGNLSKIKNYKIDIPKELCVDNKNNTFKEEQEIIINNIKKANKIRVWTSNKDVYSYLIMLFVSSIIKKYNYELYIVNSTDYNEECISPGMLRETELEQLSKKEIKLTEKNYIVIQYCGTK